MPEKQEKKTKRKAINKKLRFEIFKRDNFTCQYCGRKAPDVILQIDHLKPVARGGKNDILNLVTSCIECNQGKGAREISDASILKQKQHQAEILSARLEQIEMLRDWHIELANQTNAEIEAVNSLYLSLTNNEFCISNDYKISTIGPLIKKYGLALVLEALTDGSKTYGNCLKALNKLPGICVCKNDPILNRRLHILHRMRKRFPYFNEHEARDLLYSGYVKFGIDFYDFLDAELQNFHGSWNQVKIQFSNMLNSPD